VLPLMEKVKSVAANSAYEQYMLLPWQPIFLSADAAGAGTAISLPGFDPMALLTPAKAEAQPVRQTYYGINQITYQVSLDQPKLMIENEMYFPGWEARLVSASSESRIQARSVNGVFRAWLLPAGNYQLVAAFALPGLYLYYAISLAALLLWLAILLAAYRRRTWPP
jgi:hypothetical protein